MDLEARSLREITSWHVSCNGSMVSRVGLPLLRGRNGTLASRRRVRFYLKMTNTRRKKMYTRPQVWAVISYGPGQFDIFSADTEEEILSYCEDNGYTVEEWRNRRSGR